MKRIFCIYLLLMTLPIVFSCGGDDGDSGETSLDACGNPTTETVNDKRCEYTVSTLTGSFEGSGGLTVDAEGFIYVADFGNSINIADGEIVTKIDPVSGALTEFARGLNGPSGNEFAANGNLIQANIRGNFISEITPDGTVTEFSNEGLASPVGVAIDDAGNVFVCNCGNRSVQKFDTRKNSTQFVSSGLLNCPNGLTIDENNNLYVANFNGSSIVKIDPNGNAELLASLPGTSNSHLVYGNGVLYALSRAGGRLYEVTLTGEVSIIAGNGQRGNADGSGENASFYIPNGIDLSPDGSKIYVVSRVVGQGSQLNPVLVRVIEKK